MNNITFDEFNKHEFKLFENNPIIKNPLTSFVIADPSVLTPENSHDNKFHLFCHTFFGVYLYDSDDGMDFKRKLKITNRAMRPNINYIDGTYYLFYERTKPVICNLLSLIGLKWKSEIYCKESTDLKNWREAYPVITKSKDYHEDNRGIAISNPFLLKVIAKYRLYYSCGLTFIDDCGFCEPTHISFAESNSINKDYISLNKPIISPNENSKYLNLCSGCLKVYKLKDCYIGLQNGIFKDGNKSYSAIMLLKSSDGINFEFIKPFLVPQKCGNSNWMAQYVYACCLTKHENKLRLYFNARNVSNNLLGRESIGVFEAEL
ncbi:MAG: glycosyl hydrolase family 43 [Clostridia bacterium]|nr:glycosyl hydrolase family 43 [Clostridia bacterium]